MAITGIKLNIVQKEQRVKLRTTVGALLEGFTLTKLTLDKKGPFANLYLNAKEKTNFLYMYSSNSVSETATKIKVEVETPGEVLINPGKLSDGLNGLDKKTPVLLNLNSTGSNLKVQAGTVKFSLTTNTLVKELGDRLRAIPSDSTPLSTIPVTEVSEFIKRSQFCIPNDQTGQKASLGAMRFVTSEDKEEAFATDGSIAVHISSTKRQGKGVGTGNSGIQIPSQVLQSLYTIAAKKKGESVSIIQTEKKNKLFCKFADGTHFGALTAAIPYPNIKPIFEQTPDYVFEISREALQASLSRANSFMPSSTTKEVLEIELTGETIAIKANGDDCLDDTLDIKYKGNKPKEAIRLGMNVNHLLNITASSHSEILTIGFTSPEKPMIITDIEGDEEEQLHIKYVVMGARIDNPKK